MNLITKFEVYIEHFEAPAKWVKPEPAHLTVSQRTVTQWTEKDLMHYAACSDDRDPELIGSYDTIEEAAAAFMAHRKDCSTSRVNNRICFTYLYVEENRYDEEDGEWYDSMGTWYEYVEKLPEED